MSNEELAMSNGVDWRLQAVLVIGLVSEFYKGGSLPLATAPQAGLPLPPLLGAGGGFDCRVSPFFHAKCFAFGTASPPKTTNFRTA
jgi:hypothetical protein